MCAFLQTASVEEYQKDQIGVAPGLGQPRRQASLARINCPFQPIRNALDRIETPAYTNGATHHVARVQPANLHLLRETTMTVTTFPSPAPAIEIEAESKNPFFDLMSKVGNLYSDSMQPDASELWLSSARIVQERTTPAIVNATRECISALAQNAADIQQRSFARLGAANQKAFELMTTAFTDAMARSFKPGA
jgi:hypothetical protein